MNYFGKTDIGKKRSENQDCFTTAELDGNMTLLTVCDGMGGENGGATASRTAIDSFNEYCRNNKISEEFSDAQMRNYFSCAVEKSNKDVFSKSEEDIELSGMGTTLVSALYMENSGKLFIINVGDSRAYLITENNIERISHDHSYVQYLVDMGEITEEEAFKHPKRNLITKFIGTCEIVKPDVDRIETDENKNCPAYILLCSDGLTDLIKDDVIKNVVISEDFNLEQKADLLISKANQKGGKDNITVILAQI